MSAFNIFWIIFTIICVELTLNYNHVQGVLAQSGMASAGQLLPLLIGVFSTTRLAWIIYREGRSRNLQEQKGGDHLLRNRIRRKRFFRGIISVDLRHKSFKSVLVYALTHWMPWLNCFPFWIRVRERIESHHRLSTSSKASVDVERHESAGLMKT